jgi:hypothetical protein
MATPRWVWIVVGLFAFLAVGCFAMIGTGVYFFRQHVDLKAMSATEASAEINGIRERFKDQRPLIEIESEHEVSTDVLEERANSYKGPLPEHLHILAWEEDERHRVRLTLPFWLLKWKSGHGIKLNLDEVGIERLEVSAEELQRAGPALVVDHTDGRKRLLVWTE